MCMYSLVSSVAIASYKDIKLITNAAVIEQGRVSKLSRPHGVLLRSTPHALDTAASRSWMKMINFLIIIIEKILKTYAGRQQKPNSMD